MNNRPCTKCELPTAPHNLEADGRCRACCGLKMWDAPPVEGTFDGNGGVRLPATLVAGQDNFFVGLASIGAQVEQYRRDSETTLKAIEADHPGLLASLGDKDREAVVTSTDWAKTWSTGVNVPRLNEAEVLAAMRQAKEQLVQVWSHGMKFHKMSPVLVHVKDDIYLNPAQVASVSWGPSVNNKFNLHFAIAGVGERYIAFDTQEECRAAFERLTKGVDRLKCKPITPEQVRAAYWNAWVKIAPQGTYKLTDDFALAIAAELNERGA